MDALLSEHWHAVRGLRPRLRQGVQVAYRRLRGRPWVLLIDPLTQRFHRVAPKTWAAVRLMDGSRTLDDLWAASRDAPPAAAPCDAPPAPSWTQGELVELLSTLHAQDLLETQVAADAEVMHDRHVEKGRRRLRQYLLNPMSVRLPLGHPDAWFTRQAAWSRHLVGLPALLLWLALVLPCAVLAVQHGTALTENLADRVLTAGNLLLMVLVYPFVKAVHELAHGWVCKAHGGTVREIGVMFLVFAPVPYVDASSSYAFASKWQRAAVAAAGVMAELALGALALLVWLNVEPGAVRAVAYNVILIAGVSSLLVNGNPLMRYDGYYVMTDLLEVPNLAPRATQYWTYLVDRYLLASPQATPPVQARGERVLLAVYGALSPVYRLFITFGLIAFVATQYLLVGVVMALMAAWASLVVPVWRGLRHLAQAPSVGPRRGRAWLRAGLAAATVAGLLAWPLPWHVVHQGVVWVPDEALVRAGEAGRVTTAAARTGPAVADGAPLLQIDNPALHADLALAAAELARSRAELRQAQAEGAAHLAQLRDEVARLEQQHAVARSRVAALQVAAPAAGRWMARADTELAGRHVDKGELLGYMVDAPSAIVRSAVSQDDFDLIRTRLAAVQVRLAHERSVSIDGRLSRVVPGGDFQLVSPALGLPAGGDIAVDPTQAEGTRALSRVFDLEIGLAGPAGQPQFGERAHVRFDLGEASLAERAWRALRQLFMERFSV